MKEIAMNKEPIKNTVGMFDLIKGLIMIMVMVNHTYGLLDIPDDGEFINELINQVSLLGLFIIFILKLFSEAAMPIMFILSGYGFRKMSNKKCILKNSKMLLIPYAITVFFITIIHFFSYYILYSGVISSLKQTISIFLGCLFGLPKDRYINNFRLICCGPGWFLLALIISNLIYNLLANHIKNKNILLLSSFLVSCLGWILSFAGPLPWALSQGLIAVFFVGIGHFVKKNKFLIYKSNNNLYSIVYYALIILYIIFVSTNNTFDMANDMYPFGPISIVANGLIAILFLKIFIRLNRFRGLISTLIRRIGRQSLYVLCIHTIEMVAIGGYVQYLFVNEWWHGNTLIRSLIIICTRIAIVLIFTLLFLRVKEYIKKAKTGDL